MIAFLCRTRTTSWESQTVQTIPRLRGAYTIAREKKALRHKGQEGQGTEIQGTCVRLSTIVLKGSTAIRWGAFKDKLTRSWTLSVSVAENNIVWRPLGHACTSSLTYGHIASWVSTAVYQYKPWVETQDSTAETKMLASIITMYTHLSNQYTKAIKQHEKPRRWNRAPAAYQLHPRPESPHPPCAPTACSCVYATITMNYASIAVEDIPLLNRVSSSDPPLSQCHHSHEGLGTSDDQSCDPESQSEHLAGYEAILLELACWDHRRPGKFECPCTLL